MEKEEVRELLDLTGWRPEKLAVELDVSAASVFGWLSGRRVPGGPACKFMRQWLSEARAARGSAGKVAAS